LSRSQTEEGNSSAQTGEKIAEKGRFVALKRFSILIPLVMLPLGAWLGYRTFRGRPAPELLEAVVGIPTTNLLLALACAAASYLCLTYFDFLAIRYVGRRMPYAKVALTSFISLGVGHTVGIAFLSSGALRYRLYSNFGLGASDVAKIVLFCALTVGLGLMGLAGIVLTLRPDLGPGTIGLAPEAVRGAGLLCLGLVLTYVMVAWRRKKPVAFHGRTLHVPDVRIALMQISVGALNFAFVAATLYWLLAGAATYQEVASAYVFANVSGMVSHVPGGVGVLEYVISSVISHGNVIAALIAFRIIYFLIPLVLAITALVITEIVRWHTSKV